MLTSTSSSILLFEPIVDKFGVDMKKLNGNLSFDLHGMKLQVVLIILCDKLRDSEVMSKLFTYE